VLRTARGERHPRHVWGETKFRLRWGGDGCAQSPIGDRTFVRPNPVGVWRRHRRRAHPSVAGASFARLHTVEMRCAPVCHSRPHIRAPQPQLGWRFCASAQACAPQACLGQNGVLSPLGRRCASASLPQQTAHPCAPATLGWRLRRSRTTVRRPRCVHLPPLRGGELSLVSLRRDWCIAPRGHCPAHPLVSGQA